MAINTRMLTRVLHYPLAFCIAALTYSNHVKISRRFSTGADA